MPNTIAQLPGCIFKITKLQLQFAGVRVGVFGSLYPADMSGWTAEITISLQFGRMREGVLRSGPVVEMIEDGGGGDGASSVGESSSGVSCGSSGFFDTSAAPLAAGSHDGEGQNQPASRFDAGAPSAMLPSSSRIGLPCEHYQGNQRHMNPWVAPMQPPASPTCRPAYDQEWYNKRRGIALPPQQDYPQTQDSWQQIAKELKSREVKESMR